MNLAGMVNLILEPIEMHKLLHHTFSTAKGLVKEKPVELVTDLPPTLPTLMVDRRRMRQILLNVISNAVKYTPEGSVTVRAWETAESVEMSIQDTGIGISAEDAHLVFETFQQARHNYRIQVRPFHGNNYPKYVSLALEPKRRHRFQLDN